MAGKCPKCEKPISTVTIEAVPLSGFRMQDLRGVMYLCPNIGCRTVLSVGVDPIAVEADTINGVVKALRGKV